jgi:class 3 adenylate cyclase
MQGERKQVTVLFADIAGFTAISEQLDPEEVHLLMDGCFARLTKKLSQSQTSRARRRIQIRAQASCSRPKKLTAFFS